MKTMYALLPTIVTIALTLPMFGQDAHEKMTKSEMKQHDMSSMMGKPTVDTAVEGLHMKVWLMTQKEHKEMRNGKEAQMMMHGMKDSSMRMGKEMKGMKHEGMEMSKAAMDSMMAGTHHIMLDVTDAASGKEIADASARVQIVSPSTKNSSVDLKPMMSHFGGALTLDEKGKYRFTVSVNVGGVSRTTQFEYAVR